jgi:hypothetical protein
MSAFEVPLFRLEHRVLLPGVKASLPVTAKMQAPLEEALASEERRIACAVSFPDGLAPIASLCQLVQRDVGLEGERAWVIAESRVRILFARGDRANVEPYADRSVVVDPELLDRARAALMTYSKVMAFVPSEILEIVALSEDPELVANLVLTFTNAPLSTLLRALELDDAAARLRLCVP